MVFIQEVGGHSSNNFFNGQKIKKIGVLRDTARAPQPPTDPLTGRQRSLHGLAQIDQKSQFWAKFGRFGAKNPFFLLEKSKVLLPT